MVPKKLFNIKTINMEKETRNEKSMFSKISQTKRWIIIFIITILGCFILSCTNIMGQTNGGNEPYIDSVKFEMIDSPTQNIFILPHDSIRLEMIDITHRFLTKSTRGKVHPKLAEYLVDNALEHNIDLCFMMSQTKIETGFGTAGVGRQSSRRSLFGVVKKRYSDYDEAIEDYCQLLKKSYLVKGRTEQDLMRKYVTGSGYRYAGNPNYEVELRRTYKEIVSSTDLKNLQAKYKHHYNEYLAELNKLSKDKDSIDICKTA